MLGTHKEALAGQGERRLGASDFNTSGCLCEVRSCLRSSGQLREAFLGFYKHRDFLFIFLLL